MYQKSNLNAKNEKEKDENKSERIISKEILNSTIQFKDYITKKIKMNLKIIDIEECIKNIKKIIEFSNNILKNLNNYIQDCEDEKENEKCFNNDKCFEIQQTNDNSFCSIINNDYMNFCEIEKTDNIISSMISKSTEFYICSICDII